MKTFLLLVICLVSVAVPGLSGAADTILISLPQSVISDTLSKSLPIEFRQGSDSLAGTIGVSRVDNLVIDDQLMSGLISLSGRDMQINTSFGSQQIRVNVGNVDLNFSVAATSRYDKASRTLMLHPTVTGVDEQGSQNGDIGKLIIALFHDRDIPVALSEIQPIITDLGSKKLIIDMQVEDVVLKPGRIDLYLTPRTAVKK
ncbi:MAG: hypothetical protein LJE64_09565 [Desulfofustis sp.]|jgi:hypothetical protein|nr:hypothetical protein [Desulfofustis sp.]